MGRQCYLSSLLSANKENDDLARNTQPIWTTLGVPINLEADYLYHHAVDLGWQYPYQGFDDYLEAGSS